MTKPGAIDCSALLFDLDGVLVDSTASIERVWTHWAESQGIDPDTVIATAHGRPTFATLALVAPHLNAQDEVSALETAELDELGGTVALPGARELLAKLPPSQWVIVTSGTRTIAEARIRHVELPMPRVLVTADMVTRGKPAPEGYLLAAERLGVQPRDCVVVEDSPPGVEAARAAGMASIALTTTHTAEQLTLADYVISDLRDILPSRLGPGHIRLAVGVRDRSG